MSVCVFCSIVAGDIPASKVYESPEFVAFRDIQPVAPVHIIVVPKVHCANLEEFAVTSAANFLAAIAQTAQGIEHNGYRVIFNTGPDAGQTEFHVHAHILAGERLSAMNGTVN